MEKSSVSERIESLFDEPGVVNRFEVYSLHTDTEYFLKCTDEYPPIDRDSFLGTIFPPAFTRVLKHRVLWFLDQDLLSDVESGVFRHLAPLLSFYKVRAENFDTWGFSVFLSGELDRVFVLRVEKGADRQSLTPFLQKAVAVIYSGREALVWTAVRRESGFNQTRRFSLRNREYSLPMDLDKLKSELGDSVPLFFREVFHGFIKRLSGQIADMEGFLESRDLADLKRSNHKIKGASASLFSPCLNEACNCLEEAILAESYQDVKDAFSLFLREASLLSDFYRTLPYFEGAVF